MTISDTEWNILNAYVDGELSQSDRASFSKDLEARPDLQVAHQKLLSVKKSLSALSPTSSTQKKPSTYWRKYVIAASLLVVFASGSLVWSSMYPTNENIPLTLHKAFSEKTYILRDTSPKMIISSLSAGQLGVPDLSASALQLADVTTTQKDNRETISLHYRGLRGCRLTLVGMEKGDAPITDSPYPIKIDDGLITSRWETKTTTFTLLATRMDVERFKAIANYIRQATQQPKNGQDKLRVAMNETYKNALPCA